MQGGEQASTEHISSFAGHEGLQGSGFAWSERGFWRGIGRSPLTGFWERPLSGLVQCLVRPSCVDLC